MLTDAEMIEDYKKALSLLPDDSWDEIEKIAGIVKALDMDDVIFLADLHLKKLSAIIGLLVVSQQKERELRIITQKKLEAAEHVLKQKGIQKTELYVKILATDESKRFIDKIEFYRGTQLSGRFIWRPPSRDWVSQNESGKLIELNMLGVDETAPNAIQEFHKMVVVIARALDVLGCNDAKLVLNLLKDVVATTGNFFQIASIGEEVETE